MVFAYIIKKGNNNTSKQVLLSVLGVAILIVAVVGISFAAFTYTQAGTTTNTISTGTVTMAYNNPENGITINNAIPMDDAEGKMLSGENEKFDFTVTATITGRTAIDYEIIAVKDSSSTIADKDIKLYLESKTDQSEYAEVFSPKQFTPDSVKKHEISEDTMQLDSGTFDNKSSDGNTQTFTKYYRLRMWVNKEYVLDNTVRNYKVKVNVYGKGQD